MNLQNGYKVVYEKAADGKRTFYASKTGFFADAEVITEAEIGKYKLIYEKAGRFYGSESGVPSEDDYCFDAFDKIFVAKETSEKSEEDTNEEESDVSTEDKVEDEVEDETDNESDDTVEEETVTGSGDSITEEELEI